MYRIFLAVKGKAQQVLPVRLIQFATGWFLDPATIANLCAGTELKLAKTMNTGSGNAQKILKVQNIQEQRFLWMQKLQELQQSMQFGKISRIQKGLNRIVMLAKVWVILEKA